MNQNMKIAIVSGEGEQGTAERYTGKMTERAIKSRLTRERCHGDRWAKAIVFSTQTDTGPVGYDWETGDYANWPLAD